MDTDHSPHKIFESLRNAGIRRRESQWMGGVAAGVAEKFTVDTVLIRGIAVALALLGGVGMIAYGLAWAFLPDEQGRIHFEQALKKNWTLGMTGATAVFVLGVGPAPWVFSSLAPFIWPLLVIAAVLFIVFSRNNTSFAKGTTPTPDSSPSSTPGPVAGSGVLPYQGPPAPPRIDEDFRATAAGWDRQDNASAQAREHEKENPMQSEPDDSYPRPEPRAKTPKVPEAPPIPGWVATIVVGVTALIVALIFCADYFDVIAFPGGSWSLALSLGLLFVGLTLVVTALSHRTSGGLLGLAIPLLVLSLIFGNTGYNNTTGFGIHSGGQIQQNNDGDYNAVFSNASIDLRHYSDLTSSTTVEVNAVFSSVDLLLPADVPVRIETRGAFLSQGGDQPSNTAAGSGQPVLTIEVNGAFARVSTVASEQAAPSNTSDF
ncbi:PspC domain-containing protein [Glutamicibacter sp. MNS18]|uniref:PspC domain-containing protein n=1 Tax=Glutamicibacter sp. MNS18 TaxID=2989817 RepID=UPI002235E138|nr:PspC domain-containing protein [Glutamicibacter sp. MNS18]MCW4464134.1 PspC domain-containing protein [Glutamicibacter sp. MNS18]